MTTGFDETWAMLTLGYTWLPHSAPSRDGTTTTPHSAPSRDGTASTPPGPPHSAPAPAGRSAVAAVARHRDHDGALLPHRVAAVELLNVLRPTVAVAWFVAFAGHALHRWPALRERLRVGDGDFVTAFVHELRRFYPFAPFVGGRAVSDLSWGDVDIPAGATVLLDIYGQHHDPRLFEDPYTFRPERFIDRPIGAFDLLPQGGGDPATGHRCPGEPITIALLETLVPRLARLDYAVPPQDLTIPLHRIPTRPSSGVEIVTTSGKPVRPVPAEATTPPRS
jgi:fatty-acid peroxygenase